MGNPFKKSEKPERCDTSGRIISVPVEKLIPNPRQPRTQFDSDSLAALAVSIAQHGILQPLVIRRIGGGAQTLCAGFGAEISLISESVSIPGKSSRPTFEIVAGERRYRAAQMAGLREVPCILLSCSEEESAELAMIENIQRRDLNPFEEATAIASLMELRSLTQEQIAARLAVSQSYVANKLRLLRLGQEERELILGNHLSERHARALLKIEPPDERIAVLRTVIARSLNVAQTEQLIRARLQAQAVSSDSAQRETRHRTVRDLRLFYNTIEHAIDTVSRAGLPVTQERLEDGDSVEYRIRMPKKG